MSQFKPVIAVAILFVVGICAKSVMYTVDERESVIITFAGKAVKGVTDPGLHFKGPVLWKVERIPKWVLEWDGYPSEIPTLDKKYIYVDTFARWKVAEPLLYFESVQNERGAQARLDDIIDGATRDFVSSHVLLEVVRDSNRKMVLDTEGYGEETEDENVAVGRRELGAMIQTKAAPQTLAKYGIELLDVQIKKINYVEQVRQKVYERMISERQRIAELYRSQGREAAEEIAGKREQELKRITSEAYRDAEVIRGKADAEATKIYAEAYSRDAEFYTFWNTLESYEQTFKAGDTLILDTNTEYFQYLEGHRP